MKCQHCGYVTEHYFYPECGTYILDSSHGNIDTPVVNSSSKSRDKKLNFRIVDVI